jgi:heme/copper-type cytochrome/quinol oxidase subunit 3
MAGGYTLYDKNYVSPQFGKTSPGKIAMWMFLVTDALSFSGFLLGYCVLRTTMDWPNPATYLNLQLAGFATFILNCSSVAMFMSIYNAKKHDRSRMLSWLLVTIFLGVSFLAIQVYEYLHLVEHGMSLTEFIHGNNLFGSTFYAITGFHGLHILAGVIYLTCMYVAGYRGDFDHGHTSKLEIASLFWHFVDFVWILVFTFIYLV